MAEQLRLAVNKVIIEGYLSKIIPGLYIHEDGKSLTMTAMTIEKSDVVKPTDKILTRQESIDLLSTPVSVSSNSFRYEVYHDLYLKYEDFPGYYMPIFEKLETIIKIRMKKTFSLFKRDDVDKNFIGLIRYIDPETGPKFDAESSRIYMGSLLVFDYFSNEEINHDLHHSLVPALILKLPGNTDINLNECDFTLFHSDAGYYCNYELQNMDFQRFKDTHYNDIVIDNKFLNNLKVVETPGDVS